FRTADPFYADWPLAERECFAYDRKERAGFEDLAPFELDHDRENVGAIESVGPLWFERQLAGRCRLFDHPHVEKEGLGALAREYLDAVIRAAVLVVSAKQNGASAWGEAASPLEWPSGIAPTARNVERAVERELAFAWRECGLRTRRGDVD